MIDRYFDAYHAYLGDSVRTAHGVVMPVTMYGRKRHIRVQPVKSPAHCLWQRTMNHPMREICRRHYRAMINVEKRLRDENLASKLVFRFTTNLTWKFQSQRLRRSLNW